MQAYDTTSIDYNPLGDLFNNGGGYNNGLGENGFNGAGGYTGGGGGYTGGGNGAYTPTPTPVGNDIKLVLTNISEFKYEMTFDIQNNVYQEDASVNIDSNKINDSLIIKPIVNDKFKTTNYFELQKALISKQIDVIDVVQQITPVININPFSSIFGGMSGNTGVSGLFGNSSFNFWKTPETKKTLTVTKKQTKQISGVRLVEFTNSEVIKSVTDYEFPLTKTLNFDIERVKKPVAVTNTITQAIQFISNYKNDTLNNEVNIKVTSGDILNGVVNTKLQNEVRFTNTNGTLGPVKIELSGFDKFLFKTIRWQYTDKFNENSDINLGDFNIVNDTIFNIDAATFNKNILILVEVAPDREDYPLLELVTNTIDQVILESIYASPTNSKLIDVDFSLKNTDFVKVTTPYRQYNVDINASSLALSKLQLDLKKDFLNNEGSFKVVLVPSSTLYGDGDPQYVIIKLSKTFDTPIIDKIDYPTNVYIPSYTFGDVNFKVSFESKLATTILIYHSKEDDNTALGKFGGKDFISLNYKDLKNRKIINSPLNLLIVPYNGNVKGEIERITINFDDAGIYVSTPDLKTNLFNAIAANLNLSLGNEQKYLSHLASFDIDDKEILISNWDIDYTTFTKFKKDSVGNSIPDGDISKSIVLKLYEALPANINKNDTLWVSRLMSLPIIQRVVVSSKPETNALPLRAPNFNIEVDYVKGQSTIYESYDDLILSGSESSQQIVDKLLSQNFVETSRINIDYSNFSNFVKYSSVVERLANFKYKKELAEYYEDRIGYLNKQTQSINVIQDVTKYSEKLSTLVSGFDGWENNLVSSSLVFTADSASYQSFPGGRFNLLSGETAFSNDGTTYITNPNTTLTNWYLGTMDSASVYDNMNLNALKNNIPQFISEDENNSDYLLFLDMVGNHFDIIWSYIKGMTDQRMITEDNSYGINDELLYNYLESFSWDAKNLNSNKNLWGYLFGYNGDGVGIVDGKSVLNDDDGYTITPEQYTKTIWRRIANNLPYLLKHKGSKRGIKALMSAYGIPQSMLTIMEFGGPVADDAAPSTFTYETLSSTLVFNKGSYLTSSWDAGMVKAIQFRIKSEYSSSVDLVNGFDFKLYISGSNTNKQLGSLHLELEGDTVLSSSMYSFFDGNFHSILINNDYDGNYSAHYGYGDKDRIVKQGSVTGSGITAWCADTDIKVGNFNGELDEFRLWKEPLSSSIFDLHILGSEVIVGNTMKSSTEDLLLRLDFEYPHALFPSGSKIKNVAPITSFMNDVSASGFSSASQYNSSSSQHWNYKYIDKDVTITLPNTGANRLSNDKIRFESQYTLAGQKITGSVNVDLSPVKRATKKAFDTAKMDSNRVGIFFSPNKDLDLDIAKSLGGGSLDDYIGDPSDDYKNTYKELDTLREYYFERVSNRNIYDFIKLIKFFDKSFFVNLKEMMPARAKVTEGLLIAPHFLERSKVKRNKPTAINEQHEGTITDTQITELSSTFNVLNTDLSLSGSLENISGVNIGYDVFLTASNVYNFKGEYDTYDANIGNIIVDIASGEYDTYESEIDYRRHNPTITTEYDLFSAGQIVGMDDNYINYGFNTYFNNGYGKYHYEENGTFKSKGVRAFIVTKQNTILTQLNQNGVSGSEANVVTSSYSQELIVQDFNTSVGLTIGGNIIAIQTASGYLPSHYIYKGEKHTGTQNLFYRGSKQTINTTIDGKEAVESFVTNPTTLRVTAQGRSNNEPILEVD
jgi:hypothetical protein